MAVLAASALALSLIPAAAPALTTASGLQPGDERTDITLAHRILDEHGSTKAGDFAVGDVAENPGRNAVKLLAFARFCDQLAKVTGSCDRLGDTSAFARGELFYEFCVPVAGSTDCGPGTGPPEDITVTVSFDYAYEGRLTSELGAGAKVGVTSRILDVTADNTLAFEYLLRESVSNGTFVSVKGVPLPAPEVVGVADTEPVVFQVTVPRGHVLRFSVFVAASAETHGANGASATFTSDVGLDGHFSVSDVEISVGAGAPGGGELPEEVFASLEELQQWLAELAEQLDGLDGDIEARFGSVNESINERLEELADTDAALQAEIAELETSVAGLSATVGDQAAQIAALEERVTAQDERIAAVEVGLAGHTHEYQAPRGQGNNRVPETTGPPQLPPG